MVAGERQLIHGTYITNDLLWWWLLCICPGSLAQHTYIQLFICCWALALAIVQDGCWPLPRTRNKSFRALQSKRYTHCLYMDLNGNQRTNVDKWYNLKKSSHSGRSCYIDLLLIKMAVLAMFQENWSKFKFLLQIDSNSPSMAQDIFQIAFNKISLCN